MLVYYRPEISFKILLAQCVRSPGGTGSSLGLGDRRVANAKQVLKKDFAWTTMTSAQPQSPYVFDFANPKAKAGFSQASQVTGWF